MGRNGMWSGWKGKNETSSGVIRGGKSPARKVGLKADTVLHGGGVDRLRVRCSNAAVAGRTEAGLGKILGQDIRPNWMSEAHLIALACSEAPPG